ncbi:unnamed protein product, partial [Laminaria digitata]
LALLLRHGKPYGELLEERGVFFASTGTAPTYGTIPRSVELAAEMAAGFNCFRRCVFVIHSDEDLHAVALGLLRHVNDARLGKTRPRGSALSIYQEALMVFSAFVHENPRFVPRLAASEELVRGTTVCVSHFLEGAVGTMIDADHTGPIDGDGDGGGGGGGDGDGLQSRRDQHQRSHPLGEEVGLLVLLSRLLLTLSENDLFMATLVDM